MGADALLDKPLDVPCLLQTIRELTNESTEQRAQQTKNRHNFRYVPCDSIEFCEQLQKRYTTPYRFNEPLNPKH
jgi:DNA-binding response OmpR family regulator